MKQFAVIGLGRFGTGVARALYEAGQEVLAIDSNLELVDDIAPYVTHAIQADATDEEELKAVGIRNYEAVIISIGSDLEASILITALCKEAGARYVLAKANSELHYKVLQKVGADKVILPEQDMALRVAHSLISTHTLEYSEVAPGCFMAEISPLKEWVNKTIVEIGIRNKYHLSIIAVRDEGQLNINPPIDYRIKGYNTLLTVGTLESFRKVENIADHEHR